MRKPCSSELMIDISCQYGYNRARLLNPVRRIFRRLRIDLQGDLMPGFAEAKTTATAGGDSFLQTHGVKLDF